MSNRIFRVWVGDKEGGSFEEYSVPVERGMVILDVIHSIQKLHKHALNHLHGSK